MTVRNRYPDADVLAQRGHWDDATRRVILDRVQHVPAFRFFDLHERATLEALCALIIPQEHRPRDRRVPLAPWIDARCAGGHSDGFRLDDMPPNPEAWRLGLRGLDETSRARFGNDFTSLDTEGQRRVLESIRRGNPAGNTWEKMPAKRWWIFIALRQITAVYYAHPFAWDEIGFGGPAYPRGYFALNHGYPEPWEARER